MAKQRYDTKNTMDIVGILDEKENGELFISINGIEFCFLDICKKALGTEIHFRSESFEE